MTSGAFRPAPSTAAATSPSGSRSSSIFPEIDYDKIDKVKGMNVVIVTTARNDEEARHLLKLMGMPFKN